MPLTTLSTIPSWGVAIDREPNVLVMKFGDGYEQRSRNGINHIALSYDVSFNRRTEKEAQALDDFLTLMGGVDAFLFRLPVLGLVKYPFICRKWSVLASQHNDFEVRGVFERDFSTFAPKAATPVTNRISGVYVAPGSLTAPTNLVASMEEGGMTWGFSFTPPSDTGTSPTIVITASSLDTIYYSYAPLGSPLPGYPARGRDDTKQYTGPIPLEYGNYRIVATNDSKLDSNEATLYLPNA